MTKHDVEESTPLVFKRRNDNTSNNDFSQLYNRDGALKWRYRLLILVVGSVLKWTTSVLEFRLGLKQNNLSMMIIAVLKFVLQQIVDFGLTPTYFMAKANILPDQVERRRALRKTAGEEDPKTPIPFPKVDLFVPCCHEPLDVIKDTVSACLDLAYPKEQLCILVLDDGGDDALREWIEKDKLEAVNTGHLIYVRRKKEVGKPHHFKVCLSDLLMPVEA
jgi:hypothetical protein